MKNIFKRIKLKKEYRKLDKIITNHNDIIIHPNIFVRQNEILKELNHLNFY